MESSSMDYSMLSQLQNTADSLFKIYNQCQDEVAYADKYLSDDSILDSGWDYHWVCTNVAGCINQLKNTGKIEDSGCLLHLGSFRFISSDILKEYFPNPEKCPIFVANLFLHQQLLDICLNNMTRPTSIISSMQVKS